MLHRILSLSCLLLKDPQESQNGVAYLGTFHDMGSTVYRLVINVITLYNEKPRCHLSLHSYKS